MVLLDQEKFLRELGALFRATRESGSLSITQKRLLERPKRGAAADDATVETVPAAQRYAVLIRARTEKKKLSVEVAGADVVKFQAAMAAVVRLHASSLKKKDRSKKQKTGEKRTPPASPRKEGA